MSAIPSASAPPVAAVDDVAGAELAPADAVLAKDEIELEWSALTEADELEALFVDASPDASDTAAVVLCSVDCALVGRPSTVVVFPADEVKVAPDNDLDPGGLGAETPIIEAGTGLSVGYEEADGTTTVTPAALVVVYRGPALVWSGAEDVARCEATPVTTVASVVPA